MGKLNLRVGTMSSIKTTEMITAAYNYEEVGCAGVPIVLKPETDTKSKGIKSRVGLERNAEIILSNRESLLVAVSQEVMARSVERPSALADDTLLLIDEAQFLTVSQAEEAHAFALMCPDNAVIAAGLRLDAMGRGFPAMARLLELAHDIQIRDSWCRCKHKASYNSRKVDGKFTFSGSQVAIDGQGQVTYQSLCRRCYQQEILSAIEAGDEIDGTTLAIFGLNTASEVHRVLTTTDKNEP